MQICGKKYGAGKLGQFDIRWTAKRIIHREDRVAAVWTAKYIYFAFWCKYEDLKHFRRGRCDKRAMGTVE